MQCGQGPNHAVDIFPRFSIAARGSMDERSEKTARTARYLTSLRFEEGKVNRTPPWGPDWVWDKFVGKLTRCTF